MLPSLKIMQPKNQALSVKTDVSRIAYKSTNYFSKIVTDYLDGKTELNQFYKYPVNIESIREAIKDRSNADYDRKLLVAALKKQYQGMQVHDKVSHHLDLLLDENCFTITTAHQPNIFTGPLYFVYKILHAIKLASSMQQQLTDYKFVPVFFMGSEDADLEELNHITVDGKKYEWKTKQTGAVGRMKVDKAFIALINEMHAQLGVLPYGDEIIVLFKQCYVEGDTIQQSMLKLVNALFGEYGLIVLLPDNIELKRLFVPAMQKEIEEQFSHKAVGKTIKQLSEHYKVQAGGRELNLFYLIDDKRERIELVKTKFKVETLGLEFTKDELLIELADHPDRFSPNVILRGVFQEQILPNIAFIGGGGELAYWLELKNVFEEVNIPYPVLVLRNSFLLLFQKQEELIEELGFEVNEIFKSEDELLKQLIVRESCHQLSLSEEKGELNSFYQQLHESLLEIDPTLAEHVSMLQAKALKRINELEKKLLRYEKRKFEAEKRKIQKLKQQLFPNGSLQERVENISGLYAREGKQFIQKLLDNSLALEQEFTIVQL
jgi:bacillithiol biosynthesis cysteine-adding enzyme BshC